MLTATSLPSPVKRTGQDPVSYFPAHHLFRALRLSKVKSPLGIQIRDKMGMTFLIFVTQAQNLLVLDTRSFIFSMSEVNTEPQKKKKKKSMLPGMFGGPHQPESPVVRASIAKG